MAGYDYEQQFVDRIRAQLMHLVFNQLARGWCSIVVAMIGRRVRASIVFFVG
jgi:hypothetical protein